jgi:hypothetical protein
MTVNRRSCSGDAPMNEDTPATSLGAEGDSGFQLSTSVAEGIRRFVQ